MVAIRRWSYSPGPAWQYKELQLRDDGGKWWVRRIGPVWMPDEEHDTEDEALASIGKTLTPEWVEAPASRSPKV